MKQPRILVFISLLFLVTQVTGQFQKGQIQSGSIPKMHHHYQSEYSDSIIFDTLAWKDLEKGLHVSFISTNSVCFSREVPDLSERDSWKGTGWKGERLNSEVLLWSNDTIKQIRFRNRDLSSADGDILNKENISLFSVQYILSDYPSAAENADCWTSQEDKENAYLLPDLLKPIERFSLPARSARPVWIKIDIPEDCKAGLYTGRLEIEAEDFNKTLDIEVEVQDHVLPEPKEWKFRLDLWQNPIVLAKYHDLEPWSDEHKMLLKEHLKLYADAGGKVITTYAVHSPWNDNSYSIEEAMIEITKLNDGSWSFDYRIFDEYIELAMEVGITDAITIYTLLPWGHRFRYFDHETGNYVDEILTPGSKEYESFCFALLDDLKKHLVHKNWMGKTYLGINENPVKEIKAAISMISKHSEDWKITYAGNWNEDLDELINDYSALLFHEPNQEDLRKRVQRGKTTTFYVCCTPSKPNNFLFSPPVENTWMGWYAAAYGYQGFLRWAFDAWTQDPSRDARHIYGPAGDCFMVYPGARSSIRFEKLREGIVDFEKIRILESHLQNSCDEREVAALQALKDHLDTFVRVTDENFSTIETKINKGKELINSVSVAGKPVTCFK